MVARVTARTGGKTAAEGIGSESQVMHNIVTHLWLSSLMFLSVGTSLFIVPVCTATYPTAMCARKKQQKSVCEV